jgi:hypothetical protein
LTPEVDPPAQATPRRRQLWAPLRWPLARYVQFWSAHRFIGCIGCLGGLALFIGLCGIITQVGGALLYGAPPEREPLAAIEQVETNAAGTVMNEPVGPVEEYIAGMRAFDAQRMWGAYNEQVRTELASRGQGPEQLQRGLTEAQQRGARVDSAERVGNYPLRDGRRYVFYVITRSGFPPDGATEELYFIFMVDPAGRILTVT